MSAEPSKNLVYGGHLAHFGHTNIIRYCNRPFKTADEMDDCMIQRINDTVAPNDILYHLGDFAFGHGDDKFSAISRYRSLLKCKNIHLILGNHDPHHKNGNPKSVLFSSFVSVNKMLDIKVDYNGINQNIVLCHYAMRVWDKSHHSSCHFFGHSHGTLPDDPVLLSFDVGVDAVAKYLSISGKLLPENYRPLSSNEAIRMVSQKLEVNKIRSNDLIEI